MKIVEEIRRSEIELHLVSRFDYRDILLPLVKTYSKVSISIQHADALGNVLRARVSRIRNGHGVERWE